jgi:hypothetical protein
VALEPIRPHGIANKQEAKQTSMRRGVWSPEASGSDLLGERPWFAKLYD